MPRLRESCKITNLIMTMTKQTIVVRLPAYFYTCDFHFLSVSRCLGVSLSLSLSLSCFPFQLLSIPVISFFWVESTMSPGEGIHHHFFSHIYAWSWDAYTTGPLWVTSEMGFFYFSFVQLMFYLYCHEISRKISRYTRVCLCVFFLSLVRK